MKLLKKIILVLLFLLPISNSFAAMVTEVRNLTVGDGQSKAVSGVDFNHDGTKMFVLYQQQQDNSNTDPRFVDEYNLSTAFDISTATYAGDSERCELDDGTSGPDFRRVFDLKFTNDGLSFFHTVGNSSSNVLDRQAVNRYDLTSPFDISTCAFANDTVDLNDDDLQNNSNARDHDGDKKKNRAQGVEINDDGTKLFVLMADVSAGADRILEYNFSTPFDLSTISLVLNAGIELPSTTNAMNLEFSANGKRLFVQSHNTSVVVQISLDKPYDTSSFNIDGSVNLDDLSNLNQLRTVTFTNNGLRMFIGNDQSDGDPSGDNIFEFNLVCPFNIIEGKCPSITENSDRTGMAEAQVELARRTIERSTNSTLNRLKWIRRNKDNQNLTNLNINLNFSNQILASLTEAVRTSATKKNKKDKKQDVFYWSEGSIAVGRMGDTSISSSKEIETNSLTLGADKFTENNGIVGLAFRYGRDNTDVGDAGSNLDGDTYNLTFYNTRPFDIDTKYIDTIIGIGKIKTDILTVMDGKHLTANRRGKQMYGTVKIKDEIKKNKLTIIPSSQIDFGHTILNAYDEVGTGAISFEKQHVKTRHLRATIAAVHDLEDERYSIKRHGKLEYQANLKRSSNLKYTYVSDASKALNTKLNPGSFHNINGEIGIDIVFPENYSIFIIYERNQALDYGHTDNIHIALGYLPNKDTEYAFKINGSENLMSKFEIKKDINGFNLSLNLNDDLTNIGNAREANIELNKVF
ncbi:MAG: autotransporter domain-containing protein [Candidatus Pelagibacter sp.]